MLCKTGPTHINSVYRGGDTGNNRMVTGGARRSGRHLAQVKLWGSESSPGPYANKRSVRCSNKGFLSISTADSLGLLDWTARQTRSDNRRSTPKQLAPLFDRLGISVEIWSRLVKDFGKLFSVVAGLPKRIDEHRSKDSSRG